MKDFHEKVYFLAGLTSFLVITFFAPMHCAVRDDNPNKLKLTDEKDGFESDGNATKLRAGNAKRGRRSANSFIDDRQVLENTVEPKTTRDKFAKNQRNELYPWWNETERRETGWSTRTDENASGSPVRVERATSLTYPPRNSTDYYERRGAVMQKFYDRQRQIAEKYKKTFSTSPKPLLLDFNANRTTPPPPKTNSNFPQDKKEVTSLSNSLDRDNLNIILTNRDTNSSTIGLHDRTKNSTSDVSNVPKHSEDSAFKYPKKRITEDEESDEEVYDDDDDDDGDDDALNDNHVAQSLSARSIDDTQRWGVCTGKLVYQHNLLLGLHGPSNLNAIFEVTIQESVCITCVEVHRYNRTRATVTLNSGGRGYEFVKLKLQGYENEGFSYVIKVWAVRKVQSDCRVQLTSSA